MEIGERVFVRVNNGALVSCQVIDIHGDIVRVAGDRELELSQAAARPPLGVGFPVLEIIEAQKAKRH